MTRTVVVGFGNSLRGDDAAGLACLKLLEALSSRQDIVFHASEESSINLLHMVEGADDLLLLDTISTVEGKPGTVHQLTLEDLGSPSRTYATHQMGACKVLELGRKLGLVMPERTHVLALEIRSGDSFRIGVSPEAQAGVRRMAAAAAALIEKLPYRECPAGEITVFLEERFMANVALDLTGLKCPQPAMRIAAKLVSLKPGDVLEATADCPTFEDDVRGVCKRWRKVLMAVRDLGGGRKVAQIQI